GIGQSNVPLTVPVGVHVGGNTVVTNAERPVGQPVSVGVDDPNAPMAVEVDQRPSGVLDPVEAQPPQLSGSVGGHTPRPGSVVGEKCLRNAVVVDVEHRVIGDTVAVQIRERVIMKTVAIEIQTEGIEPAVTV